MLEVTQVANFDFMNKLKIDTLKKLHQTLKQYHLFHQALIFENIYLPEIACLKIKFTDF